MQRLIVRISLLLLVLQAFTSPAFADNIDHPSIHPQPIIKWGNSSYHDSLGARDPFVVKDQGTYYLYYDCQEDLLNPSFESNLGTSGWDTWNATVTPSSEQKRFGAQSLKITNTGTEGGGAYTGNYYFGAKTEANLAMPAGLEVTPNTTYIASSWVYAHQSDTAQMVVQQFSDDPYGNYSANAISDQTAQTMVTGNSSWQRISAKLTTSAETSAITISLIPGLNQTSYWDGVQLERVDPSVTTPTPFPTEQSYNQKLEDTIGWRSCLATSTDGLTFTKKGQLTITGPKGDWENKEKPGMVGSSGMYVSPFFHEGYWYSYTWVAGYQLGDERYTADKVGTANHRQWYGDMRAFLPNGPQSRSGLIRSQSLLGPFERVSPNGPQILPNSAWGDIYLTANGVPQQIGSTWALFLAGAPGASWESRTWTTISPGVATGPTPLGPWTVSSTSPLLPDDLEGAVPEGPIYYKDGSGKHVMFINDIGKSSVDAYWTFNALAKWLPANRKTIVTSTQAPWAPGGASMGLATVVEKDSSTLLVYFAARTRTANQNGWNSYLFHDIGLVTLSLPLFPSARPPGDFNGDSHVDIFDYNALVAGFGTKYTIYDYNSLVANFGK